MRDMTLELTCPFCGESHFVEVAEPDYVDWLFGSLAQDVFPYLTPTEREQLISEMCPKCQYRIFGNF